MNEGASKPPLNILFGGVRLSHWSLRFENSENQAKTFFIN